MLKAVFEQIVAANFPQLSIKRHPDSGAYVDNVVETAWTVCNSVMDKGGYVHKPVVISECKCIHPSFLKGMCIFCQGVERCRVVK